MNGSEDTTQLDDQVDNNDYVDDQSTTDDNDGSNDGAGGQGGQNQDEYFLDVDERHRYRTSDEAKNAFAEAGRTIGRLSAWEKEIGQRYNIRDPKQVAQLLDELATLRQGQKTTGAPKDGAVQDDSGLSEQDKKALKWMQTMLPQAGAVTKTELEEIKTMLKEIQGFKKQSEDQNFNSLVDNGRNQLSGLLKENKLVTGDAAKDKKLSRFIENHVKAYIDEDDERAAMFFKGGSDLAQVIADGFKDALEALNIVRKPVTNTYVQNKNQAQIRNGRPMPRQNGVPNRNGAANKGNGNGNAPVKKEGITSNVHNRAWEAMQRVIHGGNAEE